MFIKMIISTHVTILTPPLTVTGAECVHPITILITDSQWGSWHT